MKRLLLILLVACGGSPKPPPPAEHQHGMHHRFDDASKWAQVFDDPARDAWQQPEKVIAALELQPQMVVADVGAGTGYFAVRIAPLVKQVIATDVEPDMVRYLGERAVRENHPNLRAVTTPGDDPKLEHVDRILVVDVWHHLDDRAAYAGKLAAALNDGGFVAVVDFKHDATHGPPPMHRLTPESVAADLQAGGLVTSIDTTTLPEQYIVYGRKKPRT